MVTMVATRLSSLLENQSDHCWCHRICPATVFASPSYPQSESHRSVSPGRRRFFASASSPAQRLALASPKSWQCNTISAAHSSAETEQEEFVSRTLGAIVRAFIRGLLGNSLKLPEGERHRSSSAMETRPSRPKFGMVMGASSSGLRTPDLLPESEPAGPRDLSSTASPRRDATRGSRSRPASRPESEETRPACRWSNPSRPRPALHVTRRRAQGGGARAHVTVPEPKFF